MMSTCSPTWIALLLMQWAPLRTISILQSSVLSGCGYFMVVLASSENNIWQECKVAGPGQYWRSLEAWAVWCHPILWGYSPHHLMQSLPKVMPLPWANWDPYPHVPKFIGWYTASFFHPLHWPTEAFHRGLCSCRELWGCSCWQMIGWHSSGANLLTNSDYHCQWYGGIQRSTWFSVHLIYQTFIRYLTYVTNPDWCSCYSV